MDMEVIEIEGLHGRVRDAVRVPTAICSEVRNQTKANGKFEGVAASTSAAVVGELWIRLPSNGGVEALFDGLDHQVADCLAVGAPTDSTRDHDFEITDAERDGHSYQRTSWAAAPAHWRPLQLRNCWPLVHFRSCANPKSCLRGIPRLRHTREIDISELIASARPAASSFSEYSRRHWTREETSTRAIVLGTGLHRVARCGAIVRWKLAGAPMYLPLAKSIRRI